MSETKDWPHAPVHRLQEAGVFMVTAGTFRKAHLCREPAMLDFHEHASRKLIRSPTYSDVARPISRGAIGRWRHYHKYLEPYLDQLASLVEGFGYEGD